MRVVGNLRMGVALISNDLDVHREYEDGDWRRVSHKFSATVQV